MFRSSRGGAVGYSRGRGSFRGGRPFRSAPSRGGLRSGYGINQQMYPVNTIILDNGIEVPLPQRNGGYKNHPYDVNNRMQPRRERLQSGDGHSRRGDNRQYPRRPLVRVTVKSRNRSESQGGNGDGPSKQDGYRMEVNEYVKHGAPDSKPIACVTVRDLKTLLEDEKQQRRIWIPVNLCHQVVEVIKGCGQKESETSEKLTFNVDKVKDQTIKCTVTGKEVTFEHVGESVRLRTYMDAPSKTDYNDGDIMEVVELRNELLAKMIKFLNDVATRYQSIPQKLDIPSLYSYSGERRFYYDLRETRWGVRLHISQVTDLHRNVIGIPLESVLEFRDRINQIIDALGLSSIEGQRSILSGKPKKTKFRRNRRNQGRRVKQVKSGDEGNNENDSKETDEKVDLNAEKSEQIVNESEA